MLMHLEAIPAGTGRGVLPCYVGDGHRLLERLTPPIPEIAAEYWIIVHRDLRRSAYVRAVIDWMKRLFAEQRDVLAGVRHKRAGRIEQRDGKLYAIQSTETVQRAAV
jgi:hypothetical protein